MAHGHKFAKLKSANHQNLAIHQILVPPRFPTTLGKLHNTVYHSYFVDSQIYSCWIKSLHSDQFYFANPKHAKFIHDS